MNDQQYFSQYKDACRIIFSNQFDDAIYFKDIDCKYQAITQGMLKYTGALSMSDAINHTNSEILIKSGISLSKLTGKIFKQDQLCIKTRKRGIYLEILPYKGITKIVVVSKTPIINPDSNTVVGIYGQISALLWPNITKTLFRMHGTKGLLLNAKINHDPLKDYPLNNIQHMVLFFCLNNYSYTEIALLMNEFGNAITPVKVNEILEHLKLIFHVRSKTQLIEKAIGLNFHAILPCDLFNNFESIETTHDSAIIVCCDCRLHKCAKHSGQIRGGVD